MEWRGCPSFPGYEVSRCGMIKGPGGCTLSPRILNGYETVGLYNGPFGVSRRKRTFCRVHRLVAEAFLDDWDSKMTVDHIDRNRRNNHVENLRMATMIEQHAHRDTSNTSKGKRLKVERVCPDTGIVLEIHASMTDGAKAVGGDVGNVWRCIVGKTSTSYGYSWRYHASTHIDGEVWKQYGNTNVYVSNLGRFKRRTSKGGYSSAKNASEFTLTIGYPMMGIGGKNVLCHRVVAETFLGSPPDCSDAKFVINHIDGNKENASVANLEWMTESENAMHAHDTGLCIGRKRIVKLCPTTGTSVEYDGICMASRATGISRRAIGNCLNGWSRKAGGYVWRPV